MAPDQETSALQGIREVRALLKKGKRQGSLTLQDIQDALSDVESLDASAADARLNGSAIENALDQFYDKAAVRLRELWNVLAERDREDLRKTLGGVPATRRTLRLRGLVKPSGEPFGRILKEWLIEEQP